MGVSFLEVPRVLRFLGEDKNHIVLWEGPLKTNNQQFVQFVLLRL